MNVRRSAFVFHTHRLAVVALAATLAIASLLGSAPRADAADDREISGTFTIPATGVESFWPETVGATLYKDGEWYKQVELDTAAKTFSVTGVAPGEYTLQFSAAYVCDGESCETYKSANLLSGTYGGGTGTLIDVTTANKSGLTYAWQAGRTITGTIELGVGADPAWKNALYATVSIPGPEGCQCGDAIKVKADATTGEYAIRGLGPGSFNVYFEGDENAAITPRVNLITEYYDGFYSWVGATKVNIVTSNATDIDATLEVGRTISGTVTLPGGVDAGFLGAIDVYATGANGEWASADVDGNTGAYTIYGLAPTTYKLKFESNDHWGTDSVRNYTPLTSPYYGGSYTEADAVTVDVTSQSQSSVNQTMVVGRTISGTVTLGSGIDPIWKDSLAVYARGDNGASRSAQPDPTTGAYTIRGLAPDSYTVNFDGTSLWSGTAWLEDSFAYEYYDNGRSPYLATPVNVTSTNQTGINAVMDLQVGDRNYWVTPIPTISETAAAGSTLTAKAAGWEPYVSSFTYQWLRDGSPIDGATTQTYAVQQVDVGHQLSVTATGNTSGFTSVSKTSAAVAVAVTPFTTAPTPTITGTPQTGRSLSVETGTWAPAANLAIQWFSDGAPIDGATGASYLLVAEDVDSAISVTVTGSLAGYVTTPRPSASVTAQAGVFAQTPTPTITGISQVHQQVTAVPGVWSPTPSAYSYQWMRDGGPIAGATSVAYTLVPDDGGAAITVAVTGAAPGYTSVTAVSDPVSPIGADFESTPVPTISGDTTVGEVLTAGVGTWSPVPTSYSYQWYRGDTLIGGATAETYKLTSADAGKKITVTVTGNLLGYNETSSRSAETVTIAAPPVDPISFIDVQSSHTFFAEISWLASEGITTGWNTSEGRYYRPESNVKREEMAAFLYRSAGSPALTLPTKSPFTDVATDYKFYKEIVWMYQEGISTGWNTNKGRKYQPTLNIKREEMAAFLYRFEGKPTWADPAASPFVDVSKSHTFYSEITWLADAGISNGWNTRTGKEYRPDSSTNREQMAAFLYRLDQLDS